MNDKYFLDTNIIVYSFDSNNSAKQHTARSLISKALTGQGCISYQVVQEFINVATRKFETPLSLTDCKKYLEDILSPLCEIFPSIDFYSQALQIKERWQYSWYDSLIVTAALQADCTILYSEDMCHGQVLNQLTVLNPFLDQSPE